MLHHLSAFLSNTLPKNCSLWKQIMTTLSFSSNNLSLQSKIQCSWSSNSLTFFLPVSLSSIEKFMTLPFLASYWNWLLKTFAVQSTYQGFIQAFLLTSVFYEGLSFVGSRGKAPGSFGHFANSKFSNSLSMHNLISFFRSLFHFFTPLMTPKGKKRMNKALSK